MNRRTFLIAATGVGASMTVGRRKAAAQQNQTATPTPTPPPTPTPSPTPSPTPTPTPQQTQEPTQTPTPEEDTPTPTYESIFEGEGPTKMEFVGIRYDPPGHDHAYTDEEWVEFRNMSGHSVNLKGCTVADENGELYEFDDFGLGHERTVRIHTGRGQDGDETVYMGRGRAVWNNDGDTVYFYNAEGELLVEESYSGDCESGYHPCRQRRRSTATSTPIDETATRTRTRSRAMPTAERTRSSGGSTRARATRTAREQEESTPITVGGESPSRARATGTDAASPTSTVEEAGGQAPVVTADGEGEGEATGDRKSVV